MSIYVHVCVCTLCTFVYRKRMSRNVHVSFGHSMAHWEPVWFAVCFKSNIHLYMMSLHFPKKSIRAKFPITYQCHQDSLRGNNTAFESCLVLHCLQDIRLKHLTCVGSEAAIMFGMIFPSSVHQLRQTSWFYEYSYSISVETENNTIDSWLKFSREYMDKSWLWKCE